MNKINIDDFKRGFRSGLAIGLGYLSVSITFGIGGIAAGLSWWQTLLISMLTLTSAGQFAALDIMMLPMQYVQMLIAQLTINIRYCFMSVSLAQKTDEKFKGMSRVGLGFFITDEIFAVASQEKSLTRSFFIGLSILPYFGWAIGTLIGTVLGAILPAIVLTALGIAIYGMFIAIIVPELKSKAVLVVCLAAAALSCAFTYIPVINSLSIGIVISICSVAAAAIGALLFPVKDDEI